MYRLSCLKTDLDELGLPFAGVVERVFHIARTTWQARSVLIALVLFAH